MCEARQPRGTAKAGQNAGLISRDIGSRLPHAFSHLAIPGLHAGGAAGVLPAAPDAPVDPVAACGVVFFLCLVESVLPASGDLFDGAGLPPGDVDGSLPARGGGRRVEGRVVAGAAGSNASDFFCGVWGPGNWDWSGGGDRAHDYSTRA